MEQILVYLKPWYKSIAIFLGFFIIRLIYKCIAERLLYRIASKLNLKLFQEILYSFEKPINLMLLVAGISLAINSSPINDTTLGSWLKSVMRSTFIYSFFWGVYNITYTTHTATIRLLERLGVSSEPTLANVFSTIAHIFVVTCGFVTIAKEWNYDITGFLASLSIGSVAVAFAAKDTLANVFGSMVIILDKPFKVGDWISANGTEGIVEKISFRSTCVRTFPDELVYIPNNLLSNTHITNFTKRERTRIDFILGFTYNTSKEKMEKIIEDIKSFLAAKDYVIPATIDVSFCNYADSSLNVRIICYTIAKDGTTYRRYQSDINLGLLDVIEKAGVSCAFPSTSIYFENNLDTKPNEK